MPYVNSYKDWPTVEVKDGRETRTRSLHFPRLTIDELKGITAKTPKPLSELGSWGTPSYMILDARGERLGDKLDRKGVTTDKMLEDLGAAQKTLGAGAGHALYLDYLKCRDGVLKPLADDDLAAAVKALKPLDKLKGLSEPMEAGAKEARDAVTAAGEERLASIEEELDGDERTAALKELASAFRGHPLAKEIRKRLGE